MGFRVYRSEHPVFCDCDWIHRGMQPATGEGETGMIETYLLDVVTVLLLIYLVYALLRPEKF